MRLISSILLISQFVLISYPAFAFHLQVKDTEMEIIEVRQNSLIGNKGSNHGIMVGMFFQIHQDGVVIGTAEVKITRVNLCGLKISEIKWGFTPRKSDILKLSANLNTEKDNILDEMENEKFNRDKLIQTSRPKSESTSDYYFRGETAAGEDYGSAFGGGFVAGLLGGLIGWGIGYAIVSGQGADVPTHYTADLNSDERLQFDAGYKQKIKSKRKSTFNTGALVGTLTVVALIVAANSNSSYE